MLIPLPFSLLKIRVLAPPLQVHGDEQHTYSMKDISYTHKYIKEYS